MLVIGPGGGKEVLLGLFGEVDTITGVEVNPDFVQIVKDHKAFDGGIYSDFPNVRISRRGRKTLREAIKRSLRPDRYGASFHGTNAEHRTVRDK